MQRRLTFEDFVLIAAAVQDAPADEVEAMISRPRAERALAAPFPGPGEIVLYPDPVERAAICCSSIIRERPMSGGNKRVGYECMREMLGNSPWPRLEGDPTEIPAILDGLAEGRIDEADFARWVRARVGLGEWLRYAAQKGPMA